MQLRPRNDFLIVELIDEPYEGQILMPETSKRGCVYGEIMSSGTPQEYEVGQTVIFKESESEKISLDLREFRAIRSEKVIAVLEKTLEERF